MQLSKNGVCECRRISFCGQGGYRSAQVQKETQEKVHKNMIRNEHLHNIACGKPWKVKILKQNIDTSIHNEKIKIMQIESKK